MPILLLLQKKLILCKLSLYSNYKILTIQGLKPKSSIKAIFYSNFSIEKCRFFYINC